MAASHLGKLILQVEEFELDASDGSLSEPEERVLGSFGLINLNCDLDEVDDFGICWIELSDGRSIKPLGRSFLRSRIRHHCFLWWWYLEDKRESSWLKVHLLPLLHLPFRKK